MKKISYEAPDIVIRDIENEDIITTSGGDTPIVSVFEW